MQPRKYGDTLSGRTIHADSEAPAFSAEWKVVYYRATPPVRFLTIHGFPRAPDLENEF